MPQTEFRSDSEMLAIVQERAGAIRGRRRRWLMAGFGLVAVLALVTGLGLVAADRGDDPERVATGGRPVDGQTTSTTLTRPPLTDPEGWEAMARSPLSARANPVSVWTGEEMLVWRGTGAFSDACGIEDGIIVCGDRPPTDGGAYDPSSDTWRPLPDAPMPEPNPQRTDTLAVWTGAELLVWGGDGPSGAAYDPAADAWRTIATSPLSERKGFSLTWTGEEVVVWGGTGPFEPLRDGLPEPAADGAVYNPTADTWRLIGGTDAIPRARHAAVWAGAELILIGGSDYEGNGVKAVEAYDPTTDSLRRLADLPVGGSPEAVWTGSSIVALVDGVTYDAPDAFLLYEPAADRWVEMPAPPVERPANLIWTGREALVQSAPAVDAKPTGEPEAAAFDPASGTWRVLPPSGLSPRARQAAVWTGTELLLWGGEKHNGFTSTPFADGARYQPGQGR